VFENLVEINSLVFLMIDWERVGQNSGKNIEEIIQNVIWEVAWYIMFERLEEMNEIESLATVQRALELFAEPDRMIQRKAIEVK
jgi:hypothetical protein